MPTTGRIISIFTPKSGTKKDGGEWKMVDFVVEQDNRAKDKILFTAWGEAADAVLHKENQEVEIDFYVNAREYQGRWYNSCTVKQIKFPAIYNDEKEPDMNQEPPKMDDRGGLPF